MANARGTADRRAGVDARHVRGGPPGGGRGVHGGSANGSGNSGSSSGGGGGAATSPPPGGAVHLVAPLRVKTRLLQRARVRLVRVRCSTLTLGPSGELPPSQLGGFTGGGGWPSGTDGERSCAQRSGEGAVAGGRGGGGSLASVSTRAGGGARSLATRSSGGSGSGGSSGGGAGGGGGGIGSGGGRGSSGIGDGSGHGGGGSSGVRPLSVGGTLAHVSRLVGSSTWSTKASSSSGGAPTPFSGPDDSLRVNMVGLRVTPMPKKRPLEIDVRLPSGALLFFFFDDLTTFSAWRTALLTAARRVTDVYSLRAATLLGTGDNSRVYAVLPLVGNAAGTRRPVALKEVKKCALSAAQLECESTAMDAYAGLRHPALVPALDMFDEPDRLVTVTPYMAGGSLDKHQAPFSGRAVVTVMRSLLQCLVYLHARGIVHR